MKSFPSSHPQILAVALTAALSLSSCVTENPYTGEQQVSNTAAGAGLGAAGGALLGAVIGNNVGDGDAGRGALIGAALGGIAGGSIGNYMDQQESMLRQELRASGVSVTRRGNNIILNMPHDITFNTGSSRIKSSFSRTLRSVGIVLRKFNRTTVLVNGHTDSDGSTSYNMGLSRDRARSVSSALASQGVHSSRLVARGFGESQPIASNNTATGKARNRRVEIHIAPRN
ncbi:MAG: cell envelope biogenesis protein OmpA [Roseibacillus sp.]|jgi:outer membrane protein OmpA-like peptidoglycan-associated protein|nr:cell envelope biogenesis protein OmpA [Roseibacillus sp.]MBP35846.1 cell envelope biogenesis protein OmpA [Roseibacillus sp.]MCP4728481.1 OmpA family protein [Roseibacillus sp.]MDP7307962.1 OmpA family protein [Roseibacillus sp.]MDP7656260.1 OmpA family protein [Roseibacillus sp.]|tara:strand:- start:5594 stop:6280 length:687 start_codon:yes stop_codon:yes gene_type:complete